MRTYISTSDCVERLLTDPYAAWTYRGAMALVEYLEEIADDVDFTFNVIDIRLEFAQWSDAVTCATAHGWKPNGETESDDVTEKAVEWLQDRATVIMVEGARSIIVSNF